MATSKPIVVAEPRYVILRNLGASTEVITPDSRERAGQDLLIRPFDAITLRASEFRSWDDDTNLASVLESGRVVMTRSNVRVRSMPRMPDTTITDPIQKSIIAELVYGSDERFNSVLAVVLDRNPRASEREFMDETYPELLKAAREWLVRWGPPEDLKWRVDALNEKLVAIKEAKRSA